MNSTDIIWALIWFALLGGALGAMLAAASKAFEVKTDPRVEEITVALPGANCGGCGFAGCAALAEAIARGDAGCSACTAGGEATAKAVAKIMGVAAKAPVRMRAQVMCSGTHDKAKLKYKYDGAPDCNAVVKLSGGDKFCPNGCIGQGTCVAACKFGAIKVIDGVAVVDYNRCTGCGMCVKACPKYIIKLIPHGSDHWVGCMSVDDGKNDALILRRGLHKLPPLRKGVRIRRDPCKRLCRGDRLRQMRLVWQMRRKVSAQDHLAQPRLARAHRLISGRWEMRWGSFLKKAPPNPAKTLNLYN